MKRRESEEEKSKKQEKIEETKEKESTYPIEGVDYPILYRNLLCFMFQVLELVANKHSLTCPYCGAALSKIDQGRMYIYGTNFATYINHIEVNCMTKNLRRIVSVMDTPKDKDKDLILQGYAIKLPNDEIVHGEKSQPVSLKDTKGCEFIAKQFFIFYFNKGLEIE